MATPSYVNIVAYLSLASKEVANGYTPYHKIHKLGIIIIINSPGNVVDLIKSIPNLSESLSRNNG